MKTVTFTNQKGGVGKTTSAVNFAAYLAFFGKRTLIVDMDPQGNATSGLGVRKQNVRKSVYHVLTAGIPVADCILNTCVNNLAILPADLELAGAEARLVGAGVSKGREHLLRDALAVVKDNYDFCILDCPPSLGLLTVNALTASDSILIPIQCEFYALEGLSQLMYTVKQVKKYLNPKLEVEGILITMYDKRSKLALQVEAEINKFFAEKVFKEKVPRNVRLAEAPSHGLPIHLYDSSSRGAISYLEAVKEFLHRNLLLA